jgi:hypothetical protein
LGIIPDTYAVSVEADGYETAKRDGVVVLPGESERLEFRLVPEIKTLGTVRSSSKAFAIGSTHDTYAVSSGAARALSPPESSSGLANYTAGTVQGSIASAPGVDQNSFANSILRGGKVSDAVFDYDSVTVPQGLIVEPGGNIAGAQLSTAGIATTTVTLAGFGTEGDNALAGVVNEIPALGTYPGQTTAEVATGIGTLFMHASLQSLWATPDLRWRYAVATTQETSYLAYGDGHTFYPAEAGTYSLALQTRGQSVSSANIHLQPRQSDDFSADVLVGATNYTQYATPFSGETYGEFDGKHTVFPGERSPTAAVNFASGVRGTYDVLKVQWTHTRRHSFSRLQIFQSQFGSISGGPFWDDLAFPNGSISLSARQAGRLFGLTYDVDSVAIDRHHLNYGTHYRVNGSFLNQVVPTADETVTSNPTLFSYLAYLGDTWSATPKLDVSGTLRWNQSHIVPSDGPVYEVGTIDPHLSASHRFCDKFAFRATFDRTSVAPLPLEVSRSDTANPTPFAPLAPETTREFSSSFEGSGGTQFRLTYYLERESNRIDVLPSNFRSAIASGGNPSGVGVPTNAGELRAHGFELWARSGGLTLKASEIRAFSSSAAQFAYNNLNAAAVTAGHLFPVGYVPDFSAALSYEVSAIKRLRVAPSISYESGYPYGNGTVVWIFDPITHKPEIVPNDNHVNPGANYYFLTNPAQPFNALTNPYVATLGTKEGADPNTLRTTPQTLVSLHVEGDFSPRLSAIVDAANLFGVNTPTQLQVNPYLIGPPGYAGGNPLYAAWYAKQLGASAPYTLGNGVPTNDGVHQAIPWMYGAAGYVPQAYPLARTIRLWLRYRM